jgi:hypothetical protein
MIPFNGTSASCGFLVFSLLETCSCVTGWNLEYVVSVPIRRRWGLSQGRLCYIAALVYSARLEALVQSSENGAKSHELTALTCSMKSEVRCGWLARFSSGVSKRCHNSTMCIDAFLGLSRIVTLKLDNVGYRPVLCAFLRCLLNIGDLVDIGRETHR